LQTDNISINIAEISTHVKTSFLRNAINAVNFEKDYYSIIFLRFVPGGYQLEIRIRVNLDIDNLDIDGVKFFFFNWGVTYLYLNPFLRKNTYKPLLTGILNFRKDIIDENINYDRKSNFMALFTTGALIWNVKSYM
jgi:hypothetical protein